MNLIPRPADATGVLGCRTKYLPEFSYKLQGGTYGMDVAFGDTLDIDEKNMSVWIPFADGNRVDGVGDLLEVGGIDCSRHRMNPIVLFDHGKQVTLPVALAEDRHTRQYTVVIDPVTKGAKANAFFYQGNKSLDPASLARAGVSSDYEHALFCEQLFDLMAKKYVRAGSIGYQVVKAIPMQHNYMTGQPQGLHLLNTLMLECSAVVMPANQDTVRKALALPSVCGKPLSNILVKSLSPYLVGVKSKIRSVGMKAQHSVGADKVNPESEGFTFEGRKIRTNKPYSVSSMAYGSDSLENHSYHDTPESAITQARKVTQDLQSQGDTALLYENIEIELEEDDIVDDEKSFPGQSSKAGRPKQAAVVSIHDSGKTRTNRTPNVATYVISNSTPTPTEVGHGVSRAWDHDFARTIAQMESTVNQHEGKAPSTQITDFTTKPRRTPEESALQATTDDAEDAKLGISTKGSPFKGQVEPISISEAREMSRREKEVFNGGDVYDDVERELAGADEFRERSYDTEDRERLGDSADGWENLVDDTPPREEEVTRKNGKDQFNIPVKKGSDPTPTTNYASGKSQEVRDIRRKYADLADGEKGKRTVQVYERDEPGVHFEGRKTPLYTNDDGSRRGAMQVISHPTSSREEPNIPTSDHGGHHTVEGARNAAREAVTGLESQGHQVILYDDLEVEEGDLPEEAKSLISEAMKFLGEISQPQSYLDFSGRCKAYHLHREVHEKAGKVTYRAIPRDKVDMVRSGDATPGYKVDRVTREDGKQDSHANKEGVYLPMAVEEATRQASTYADHPTTFGHSPSDQVIYEDHTNWPEGHFDTTNYPVPGQKAMSKEQRDSLKEQEALFGDLTFDWGTEETTPDQDLIDQLEAQDIADGIKALSQFLKALSEEKAFGDYYRNGAKSLCDFFAKAVTIRPMDKTELDAASSDYLSEYRKIRPEGLSNPYTGDRYLATSSNLGESLTRSSREDAEYATSFGLNPLYPGELVTHEGTDRKPGDYVPGMMGEDVNASKLGGKAISVSETGKAPEVRDSLSGTEAKPFMVSDEYQSSDYWYSDNARRLAGHLAEIGVDGGEVVDYTLPEARRTSEQIASQQAKDDTNDLKSLLLEVNKALTALGVS